MIRRPWLHPATGVLAMLVACAPSPLPEGPTPTGAGAVLVVPTDAALARYPLRPVPVPVSFQQAVARGTRTLEGVPGPRYWQQRADYRIEVDLDPATARLRGQQVVTYHNRSPDTLGIMVFHLRQNLFSEGVQRTRSVPITSGVTLEQVVVAGQEVRPLTPGMAVPPPNVPVYQIDGQILYLRLPRPLLPADSAMITMAWSHTVPPEGAPRTGHIDRTLYNVAQWYPQVAVYDDLEGWHTWHYRGNAEFYQNYGDFDVSITVPEGWIVGATGELENPAEVLPQPVRDRLAAAARADTVVRVVRAEDLGPGLATVREPGGRLTWRFIARDVRDFAWGTSDRYLWDATRVVAPGEGGREQSIAIHAFYRPEARAWREAARYTGHAIGFHARRWHPYIYPQMTSMEGPIGGMEYPMLTFVSGFQDPMTLYQVINHEVAHMWWPMMVGSNEASFAWMDEGLSTYVEHLATADQFRDATVEGLFAEEAGRYAGIAGTEDETELMRHADLFPAYGAFVVAAYTKPALLLRALEGVIGEEAVHRSLQEYSRRWLLRHPQPLDFFHTVESVAGRNLDWFWRPWFYETAVLDQAIAEVDVQPMGRGERVRVTIEDLGDAPMPVDLVVTLETGEVRRVRVPVEVWLQGPPRHTETVDVPGRVARIEIDPENRFPDIDPTNNTWVREPSPN